jgi:polyphenol oxidase
VDSPILPSLTVLDSDGVRVHHDAALLERSGIVVGFSERVGGVSHEPYASLNLAAHVGDVPEAVDENRRRLLSVLGIERMRPRLSLAEQVHGEAIADVDGGSAGSGAFASDPGGRPPVAGVDALVTSAVDVPLLLCFADCVPVVLVAEGPIRSVSVVHAGWRGALAALPGKSATDLARTAGCTPSDILAYVGPHIGACHYEVGYDVLSRFLSRFVNMPSAASAVDLGWVVDASLGEAGVPVENRYHMETCTAESSAAFYSHRTEGVTGRHGALAAIIG